MSAHHYIKPAIYDPSRRQGRRATVAAWIQRQGEPVTVDEVMEAHGVSRVNAAQILSRLVRDGLLKRVRGATYGMDK